MSAADSEAEKARFFDFIKQHPVLAAGSAIAGAGASAYAAESYGLSLPIAAGIGVTGGAAALALSSFLYLESPAYVRECPYIAGFQLVGVAAGVAFYLHAETGGIMPVPLEIALGGGAGVVTVAFVSYIYDWIMGLLGALGNPLGAAKKTANEIATQLSTEKGRAEVSSDLKDVMGPSNASSTALDLINYGPKTWAEDRFTAWTVLWDANIKDVDDIEYWTRNGNATQRAVAVKCLEAYKRVENSQGRDDAARHELQLRLDELRAAIAKPDMTYEDADARFTTNMDNPPPPIEQQNPGKSYDEVIQEESTKIDAYNEEHKEEVDAFVEEVHQQTVDDIMARAKAGPFAQGPKK